MRSYVRLILMAFLGALPFMAYGANVYHYYPDFPSAAAACEVAKGVSCGLSQPVSSSTGTSCASTGDSVFGWFVVDNYHTDPDIHFFVSCSVPQCPTGQLLPDGSCQQPCPPSGIKKIIQVKQAKHGESGELNIDITYPPTVSHTAILGGCSYTYTDGDYDQSGSCHADPDHLEDIYCSYNATSTGTSTQDADTGLSEGTANAPPGATPSESGNCMTDAKGNTVCIDAPKTDDQRCGKVNGARICFDATSGSGDINDQPYQNPNSGKRCGKVNGQHVCVSSTSESSTTKGCLVHSGTRICVNSDVQTNTQTTQTNNPDGSVTTTKTTDNNVIGDTPTVTTKTTHPNGSSTETTTQGNSSTGPEGDSQNLSKVESNTKKTADHAQSIDGKLTSAVSSLDVLRQTFDPTGISNAIDHSGPISDIDSHFDGAVGTANGYIESVNDGEFFHFSDLAAFIPATSSCQPYNSTWKGKPFVIDPCSKLAYMRDILGWLLAALTIFYIMGVMTRKHV